MTKIKRITKGKIITLKKEFKRFKGFIDDKR
jgi:hypothetical protein